MGLRDFLPYPPCQGPPLPRWLLLEANRFYLRNIERTIETYERAPKLSPTSEARLKDFYKRREQLKARISELEREISG